jgi:two-component system response regulator FlrC
MERSFTSSCRVEGDGRPIRNVLVVDDDEDFRNALAECLRDHGFTVVEHRCLKSMPPLPSLARIELVIADYELPDGDGIAFSDDFHRLHPTVPVILVSASCSALLDDATQSRAFLHLLRKPFAYDALSTLMETARSGVR